ncbi:hypothetical protein B9T62_03145 [Paenibacillus donghaensis]|uniref:Uncharacterized protein n=1 Tax=Paenibacillus donghaensis TaxID=414771 RepID=A0A2Z2K3H2_9BACL|nr:hypothetical protein [Paenibacillus donghaensis]ASA19886.1 hypothetical protein B9T62_03145 [Paenibacillus donghaensis]
MLSLPEGSSVLYAELIWSGSYDTGGTSVLANISDPILLTTPTGTFTVAPDPATAVNTAPQAAHLSALQ